MRMRIDSRHFLLYGLVFLCFFLMFIFILPSCDVFIFNRDTIDTISSAVDYSLHYGNGRFLGNFLAVFFSYRFYLAGPLIALTLGVLVMTLNMMLFNNREITIIPLALLITIPCKGMISECYYLFCSFLNYVLPIALIMITILIMRKINTNTLRPIYKGFLSGLILIITFCACLFSENTTIVLAVIAILMIINDIICVKKIKLTSIVFFVAVILGSALMYAIPVVTQTGSKMDGYRKLSTTISMLLDTVTGNFVAFTTFFSTFIPLITILSTGLIFLVRQEIKNKRLANTLTLIFVIYTVSTIVYSFVDTNLRRLNWIYLLQTLIFTGYLLCMIIAVFNIKSRPIRRTCIMFLILITCSVGPMMLVNQYGFRTFYTTFIVTLIFAVFLCKTFIPKQYISFCNAKQQAHKLCTIVCICVFSFTSLFLNVQTIYNFAFYSVRAEDILQQLEVTDRVEVPILPCNICSMEDEYFNIVSQSIGIPLENVKLIDVYTGPNSDAYIQISQASPLKVIRTVFSNLDCFDPAYFDDRI